MARREWADKVKIPRYVLSDMSEDESSNMMPHPNGAWTYYHDSLSLARKEHARAVRIVKRAKALQLHGLRDTDTNEFLEGYEAACVDILSALTKGRA